MGGMGEKPLIALIWRIGGPLPEFRKWEGGGEKKKHKDA